MAVIETWLHQDLQEPVKVNHLDGNLFSNNGNGNRIGVVLTNNGEALASISGTVSGYAVTADGSTVPCTGSKSGNKASILIPAAAYQPGQIFITVFITDGTTVTTVGAVSSNVMRSRTNAQVNPGSAVTDWTQTINTAMQSVETAAENLGGIIAVPYASITFPVPLGKYTYYNNNLYRCITPIASSESFTAAHWTQVRLGDDVSDLKSALTLVENGYYAFDKYPGYIDRDSGGVLPDNSWRYSDYIPCKDYIYFYGCTRQSTYNYFYDASQQPISSGSFAIPVGDSVTTVPAGAVYFRISNAKEDIENIKIKSYIYQEISDDINEIEGNLSEIQNAFGTVYSKNLYDYLSAQDNIRISSTGTLVDTTGFRTSDYIKVSPGDRVFVSIYNPTTSEVTANVYPDISTYTSEKTFKARNVEVDTRNNPFVIPNDVEYIRISEDYYDASSRIIMISIGARLTSYVPYSTIEVLNPINLPKLYAGKTICTFGDSLVENGGWQDYISNATGADVLNMGIGGTSMVNRDNQYWVSADGKYLAPSTDPQPTGGILCWDSISGYPVGASETQDRISLIPLNTNIVLVEFGTNDLHQNRPIGSWTDNDNNTFKGAMKLCAERIRERIPMATLIFMTPTVERTEYINTLGLHKVDYVKAILEAELEINVPVIDLWSLTSWSVSTYPNYSDDNLHWNTLGRTIVGALVTGKLNERAVVNFN